MRIARGRPVRHCWALLPGNEGGGPMTAADAGTPCIEIDGLGASPEQLRAAALDSYGHFTAMQGITMQLLDLTLPGAGLPARRAVVHVPDIGSFSAVFVTNARGVAPVGRIDDHCLPRDAGLMRTLTELYESAPWDRI